MNNSVVRLFQADAVDLRLGGSFVLPHPKAAKTRLCRLVRHSNIPAPVMQGDNNAMISTHLTHLLGLGNREKRS